MTPELQTERESQTEPALTESFGSYAGAVAICCLATVAAASLRGTLAESNLVLLYLLSVVLATVRFGRGPGIMTSILAVLSFDLFLVEPLHSFHVADPQYLLTFAIMLIVSLIISFLTANLRRQTQIAEVRASRANVQFGLSKDLAGALTVDQISEIAALHLASAFHGRGKILLANGGGFLDCAPLATLPGIGHGTPSVMAQAVFDRSHQHGETDPVSATGPLHFIPLRAPIRVRGVLVLFNCDW